MNELADITLWFEDMVRHLDSDEYDKTLVLHIPTAKRLRDAITSIKAERDMAKELLLKSSHYLARHSPAHPNQSKLAIEIDTFLGVKNV